MPNHEPLNVHEYNQLSLKDLIEPREQFHVHLARKPNVVATALGLYRSRRDTGADGAARKRANRNGKPPKTLENTQIHPVTPWPCILVFVDKWLDAKDFGGRGHLASDFIPPAVYLPDGRAVPICVLLAPRETAALPPAQNLVFPGMLAGGGYPLLSEVQGETRLGSMACLVTDGHSTYALTNRHVAGPAGSEVSTVLGGRRQRIGVSAGATLSHQPFTDVYGFPSAKSTLTTLDVGLIEIDDISNWTAQVYGLGPLGPMADLDLDSFSLRLIGCPVRAYGCASRETYGQIAALFYRYKHVGGAEYVADFLIGPREDRREHKPFSSLPGDSGTLWVLETKDRDGNDVLRPIALQWGGQVLLDGTTRIPFALATCLSTACRMLNVDLVTDWNVGHPEYWGAVGHYTIAADANAWTRDKKLKSFMDANEALFSFPRSFITKKNMQGLSKQHFVPLADVPDLVWKLAARDDGGRGHSAEGPNHFADMDKKDSNGQTLLDLVTTADDLKIETFQTYYRDVGDEGDGLLPFRVWQLFDAMVESLRKQDAVRFLVAAGSLSHYVGDACQPLHCSYMHDGDPADAETALVYDRQAHRKVNKEVPRARGVHTAYENTMVEKHTPELMDALDRSQLAKLPLVTNGRDAGFAVVELMRRTFQRIAPGDLVSAFLQVRDEAPSSIADSLWTRFGDDTCAGMADGCRTLAMLWDSAWALAGPLEDLSALDEEKVRARYLDATFIPSRTLDRIGPLLEAPGAAPAKAPARGRRPATRRPEHRA